jgi:hypothetical protein
MMIGLMSYTTKFVCGTFTGDTVVELVREDHSLRLRGEFDSCVTNLDLINMWYDYCDQLLCI